MYYELSCYLQNGKLRRTKSFRPPVTHAGSRYLIEKKKVKYGDDSDSTDCENEEDLYVKKKDRYAPVNGKPGMYYKVTLITIIEIRIMYENK